MKHQKNILNLIMSFAFFAACTTPSFASDDAVVKIENTTKEPLMVQLLWGAPEYLGPIKTPQHFPGPQMTISPGQTIDYRFNKKLVDDGDGYTEVLVGNDEQSLKTNHCGANHTRALIFSNPYARRIFTRGTFKIKLYRTLDRTDCDLFYEEGQKWIP